MNSGAVAPGTGHGHGLHRVRTAGSRITEERERREDRRRSVGRHIDIGDGRHRLLFPADISGDTRFERDAAAGFLPPGLGEQLIERTHRIGFSHTGGIGGLHGRFVARNSERETIDSVSGIVVRIAPRESHSRFSSLSLVENEGLRIGRQRQRQQRRISRHTDLHDRRKVDRFGAGDCRDTSREDHRVARLSTPLADDQLLQLGSGERMAVRGDFPDFMHLRNGSVLEGEFERIGRFAGIAAPVVPRESQGRLCGIFARDGHGVLLRGERDGTDVRSADLLVVAASRPEKQPRQEDE